MVRPLDRTLELLKYALVPAVALWLSLPAIRSLVLSSDPPVGEVLTNLVGPGLAIAYLGLLQLETVNGRIDRMIARLRRQIAMACNHDYAARHVGGIACRLTPEVFQAPVFDYGKQVKILSALSGACRLEKTGQYWFVEGNSGTGKTRTALRLVQRLMRDAKLFELGSRCYLYDFSYSDAIQDELHKQLGSSRHDDAVVLVDNFQLVKPELLRALTRMLIKEPDSSGERLIVFLTREADAWNLSPGQDVHLLSEAKAARRYSKLEGPPSIDIAEEVSKIDGEASRLIQCLGKPGLASAAQLHLAQVIARNESLPQEVIDTVNLLAREPIPARPENVRMLALLTALSMHRGTFSKRSLRRAIRVAAESADGNSLVEALRMRRTFRRFQRIGLVPKIHLDGARYIFHEDIAKQCIDRLFDNSLFASAFLVVGAARLERQVGEEDALRGWLIAVEIGDQEALAAQFDSALLHGAYQRMADCLGRAQKRYTMKAPALLQLAILLDRTGKFVASRKLFASGLDSRLGDSGELGVILAASRLEANHERDYEDDLKLLLENPSRFVAIVGEYWEIHIAAHAGTFQPQRLLKLATEAFERLEGGSHWQLYSLARIHFDSLRHLYLVGERDAAAFVSRDHRTIDEYLRTTLPTYEALHILYTKAHLVGHVFIPRLAIFGESISADEAGIAGLEPEEVATVDGLVIAAQRLYRRVREEFLVYGDREEQYLLAESLNAKMIEKGVHLKSMDDSLDEYEEFIVDGELHLLASFPHFYRFRRDMLTYFRILHDPETTDPTRADFYLDQAEAQLRRISELDSGVGNRYGEMRAAVLELLVRALRNRSPFDETELGNLERRAAEHHYGFEQRLLRRLTERNPVSPLELAEIVRFYPFVNQ